LQLNLPSFFSISNGLIHVNAYAIGCHLCIITAVFFLLTLIAHIDRCDFFTLIERFCASWEEFQTNRAVCSGSG
jgi:hypothetical protein